MRGWLVWVACCAVLLSTATASACIAQPVTYALREAWPPPDANEVPLDAPLVLRIEDVLPGVLVSGSEFPNQPLREQPTGAAVPGSWSNVGPRTSAGVYSFVPERPLKPDSVYALDLGQPPINAAADGDARTQWSFTTGSDVAPPLRLVGELLVSFELGSTPIYDCSKEGICGGCVVTGERPVTNARIRLPSVVDGFSAQGFWDSITIGQSPDNLGEGAGVSYGLWSPNEPGPEAVRMMPEREDGATYTPCFEYEAQDARGDSVSTKLCLPDPYPLPESFASDPGSAGASSDVDAARPHAPRTSKSCAFAAGPQPGVASALSALALWLSRRRRSKNAL